MYSLDCEYYEREFETLDELINNVIESGMDPNYEITKNGVDTGMMIVELIIL
jgi:hypothetical protein